MNPSDITTENELEEALKQSSTGIPLVDRILGFAQHLVACGKARIDWRITGPVVKATKKLFGIQD